jgi:hypothetical protein
VGAGGAAGEPAAGAERAAAAGRGPGVLYVTEDQE